MDIEDFVLERRKADPAIVQHLMASFERVAAESDAVPADLMAALASKTLRRRRESRC